MSIDPCSSGFDIWGGAPWGDYGCVNVKDVSANCHAYVYAVFFMALTGVLVLLIYAVAVQLLIDMVVFPFGYVIVSCYDATPYVANAGMVAVLIQLLSTYGAASCFAACACLAYGCGVVARCAWAGAPFDAQPSSCCCDEVVVCHIVVRMCRWQEPCPCPWAPT